MVVQLAQVKLGFGDMLIRRELIPTQRFGLVLWPPPPIGVHHPQVVLGCRVSLPRQPAKFSQGSGVVALFMRGKARFRIPVGR